MSMVRLIAGVGFLGAVGVGVTNGLVPGVDQPYPFCEAVTLKHPETEIRVVNGMVLESKKMRPCLGQPAYVVLKVADGDQEFQVFLGREDVIAETGLHYLPGDEFSGRAAVADEYMTAVDVDFGGEVVVLWEGVEPDDRDEDIAH